MFFDFSQKTPRSQILPYPGSVQNSLCAPTPVLLPSEHSSIVHHAHNLHNPPHLTNILLFLCSLAFASFRDPRYIRLRCLDSIPMPPSDSLRATHACHTWPELMVGSHVSHEYLRMEDEMEELHVSRPCVRWDAWRRASDHRLGGESWKRPGIEQR